MNIYLSLINQKIGNKITNWYHRNVSPKADSDAYWNEELQFQIDTPVAAKNQVHKIETSSSLFQPQLFRTFQPENHNIDLNKQDLSLQNFRDNSSNNNSSIKHNNKDLQMPNDLQVDYENEFFVENPHHIQMNQKSIITK